MLLFKSKLCLNNLLLKPLPTVFHSFRKSNLFLSLLLYPHDSLNTLLNLRLESGQRNSLFTDRSEETETAFIVPLISASFRQPSLTKARSIFWSSCLQLPTLKRSTSRLTTPTRSSRAILISLQPVWEHLSFIAFLFFTLIEWAWLRITIRNGKKKW